MSAIIFIALLVMTEAEGRKLTAGGGILRKKKENCVFTSATLACVELRTQPLTMKALEMHKLYA